jgi:hypothetical protein
MTMMYGACGNLERKEYHVAKVIQIEVSTVSKRGQDGAVTGETQVLYALDSDGAVWQFDLRDTGRGWLAVPAPGTGT